MHGGQGGGLERLVLSYYKKTTNFEPTLDVLNFRNLYTKPRIKWVCQITQVYHKEAVTLYMNSRNAQQSTELESPKNHYKFNFL